MQEGVTLPGLLLTPGQKGRVAGWPCCLEWLVLQPGLPFVFFSLYCPKDNIEEALLLLLISESMVSSKPFFFCPGGIGLQGLGHRPPGPGPAPGPARPPMDVPEARSLYLRPRLRVRLTS